MDAEQELAVVERFMRGRGMRLTSQRKLIVQAAFATHEHFSADELLAMCVERDDKVSRATVYRTLSVLEEGGFVESLDTGDGGRKFEHVLGHKHHDHMVCTGCGKILEFHDEVIEARQEKVAAAAGFVIESHNLRLLGRCSDCQRAAADG